MSGDLRAKLAGLGRDLSPALLQGTTALFAELHSTVAPPPANVHRDEHYGPAERHRLDVFEPIDRASGGPRPVLLFVHGGGFVRGDKTLPGTPFYDNVGRFAAARGWVGATMTYRLAPQHAWPSGGEDVGRAIAWLAEHCARFGGNPQRIFAMGQSAGAVHVATYVAFPEFHGAHGRALAGALLISGIYDLARADRNEFQSAYFGDDGTRYAQRSTLARLSTVDLPLLAAVTELDPVDFQRQAAWFVNETCRARDVYPRMVYLSGHNHLSSVLQIGLPTDTLGPAVEEFVAGV